MNLGTALLSSARDQPLDHLDTFANSLDAALVTQALEATGTASVRRRKLPAERAVWLMLGMALLRDRSIKSFQVGYRDVLNGDRAGSHW